MPLALISRRLDTAWYLGVVDPYRLAVGVPHKLADLLRKVRAALCHGDEDTADFQIGIQLALHLADRTEKLFQALDGK